LRCWAHASADAAAAAHYLNTINVFINNIHYYYIIDFINNFYSNIQNAKYKIRTYMKKHAIPINHIMSQQNVVFIFFKKLIFFILF
jgi:hypothetical protein